MTTSAVQTNAHVPALTSIRGIASFWVLLYHLRHEIKNLFPEFYMDTQAIIKSGFLGVDLFFVLSGFVLALNYQRKFQTVDWRSYTKFLWKRLARIYPVYFVSLCVTLMVVGCYLWFDVPYAHMERFTGWGLVQSLTMTQILSFPVPRQWNVVAWSVSAEWFAYLAFPALAFYTNRMKHWFPRLFSLLFVACAYVVVVYVMRRLSAMELGAFRIIGGFSMGVLLYDLSQTIPSSITKKTWWLVIGLCWLFCIPVLYKISFTAGLASVVWAPLAFVPLLLLFSFTGAQWGVMASSIAQYLVTFLIQCT